MCRDGRFSLPPPDDDANGPRLDDGMTPHAMGTTMTVAIPPIRCQRLAPDSPDAHGCTRGTQWFIGLGTCESVMPVPHELGVNLRQSPVTDWHPLQAMASGKISCLNGRVGLGFAYTVHLHPQRMAAERLE
jgi:hypothetical protein